MWKEKKYKKRKTATTQLGFQVEFLEISEHDFQSNLKTVWEGCSNEGNPESPEEPRNQTLQ